MDFQNRPGAKTGGGGAATQGMSDRDRRDRLAALAAETIDLAKVLILILILLLISNSNSSFLRTPTS